MHIAIEGLDGVGKTSTCEKLSEILGYRFVEKPLHYLFDAPEKFDNYIRIRDYINLQTNRKLTSWFYGLGNILTYHLFEKEDIVTDRHLVSNFMWSGTATSQPVFDCLVDLIGKPDYTFILFARNNIIRNRLRQRDKDDNDLEKVNLNTALLKKAEQFLNLYNMKYTKLDTSDLALEEVVGKILTILKQEGIIDE